MQATLNRDGFALPMAILVIGLMTAGVVASFTRVGAEVRTVDNQRGQTAAFTVAERGLAHFLVNGRLGTASVVTWDTTFAGRDSVRVVAQRIRTEQGRNLVLVRATGSAFGGPRRPPAQRTVAQFAYQEPYQMQVLSSWTSLSGVFANGAAGDFDGVDAAGTQCDDGVTRAGIAVPDGTATSTGTDNEHIKDRSNGDPDIGYLGTKQEAADAMDIDWAGIIDPANPAISPAFVRCGLSSSSGYNSGWQPRCGSWPTQTQFENYPTVLINGSMSLESKGKGLLIVTGNLTIGGNMDWDGIILVGGRITDNGTGHISGSVVSGLNMTLGETVETSNVEQAVSNGTKRYEFDSCKVKNALTNATSGFRAINNAWVDNWADW
jgi:hypothetical protein